MRLFLLCYEHHIEYYVCTYDHLKFLSYLISNLCY